MNRQFTLTLFLLLASTFCFSQEIKTHDIIINKGNDKIKLFPGEKIIIKSITGQVDICPYVKKRKRGGFLGIGRKTVKTLVHNFRKPENYPAQFSASFATGDLDIKKPIYYKSDSNNLELTKMVTFTIPDPRKCGKSHGSYSFTYTINIDERYNLLSKYLENNLNTSKQILSIDDVKNVNSQLINANLKNSNPRKVAYLLYNYLSKSNAYNSTEKLKIYEAIVDHISPDCIPMLVDLAKFAEKTGRFGLAEEISEKAIKALSNFNPSTYETRYLLANAFNTQANTKFNKNIGLKSKDLTEAASHYSLAAYNYISIGEKSKSIEAILNVSKTLKKIKNENSLKLAENSIVQFRDSLLNWESQGGWYYTNPKKPSLIITNAIEVRIDSLSKYNLKLEGKTIKGDFQELIFYPESSLTFVPDPSFDKIEINAVKAAFGSNVSITANGEKLSKNTANHGNNEKRQGLNGVTGKSGKKLTIKASVVLLESLTVNTSGSDGQNGGNGFNGDQWTRSKPYGSSNYTYAPGEKGPGEPGLGALGGPPGQITLDFFMMQPNISLENVKIISKSGKTGSIGSYGLKYNSYGHDGERPSVSSEKLAIQNEKNAKSNAKIVSDLIALNRISESQFQEIFDIKKRIDKPDFD